jgi:formylmethanofuran dehydrogenase subunit C
MSATVSIPTYTAKDPDETVRLGMDFANLLADGETISSATVAIRTAAGVDASTAMLSGSPSIDGSIVRHLVTAGTAGVTYRVSWKATTSTSQVLVEGAVLQVVQRD